MLKRIKINIAMLICLAFVFRILFANFSIVISLGALQGTTIPIAEYPSVLKNKKNFTVSNISGNYGYSAVEICEEEEEESEDHSKFKSRSFFAEQLFSSLFSLKIKCKPNTVLGFKSFFHISLPRYISLQVFRI